MGLDHLADELAARGGFDDFEKAEFKLIQEKLQILLMKKAQRGTANILRQGLMGVINRIAEDKLERVKRMVEDDYLAHQLAGRGMNVGTLATLDGPEAKLQLEDDLKDISNYCDIMCLMLRGQWK